jgi:hypothetical protein
MPTQRGLVERLKPRRIVFVGPDSGEHPSTLK